MGTWEAPKEIIDQSLGGMIAGFGQMTAGAVAGLQQRNKAKREAAKVKPSNDWRKQLKEIDRAVILLYLEEKSYQDIADIIGTSPNNIGVRIKRIKERLKIILK